MYPIILLQLESLKSPRNNKFRSKDSKKIQENWNQQKWLLRYLERYAVVNVRRPIYFQNLIHFCLPFFYYTFLKIAAEHNQSISVIKKLITSE